MFQFVQMLKVVLSSVMNKISITLQLQNHHHYLDCTSTQIGGKIKQEYGKQF